MEKLLEKAVYAACLESAIAMGARIKDISWFGKNQVKAVSEATEKLAA
jgi:hypothetical protein